MEKPRQFKLTVRVNPGSSNRAFEWKEDHLKVNVKSPPVDGEANSELLEELEELFDLKSGHVSIKSGRRSSQKILLLKGLTRDELVETLSSL